MIDSKELIWVNRYSDNENPDKHGILSRQLFYKGYFFSLIFREESSENIPEHYTVKDYYPSNGNDSPCFVAVRFESLESLKEQAEIRLLEFLNNMTCK